MIALLLVAWMVAGPLASSSIPSVARSVRNSAILGAVDTVMPNQARILYNGLRDTIANGDFPRRLRRPDPDPGPPGRATRPGAGQLARRPGWPAGPS